MEKAPEREAHRIAQEAELERARQQRAKHQAREQEARRAAKEYRWAQQAAEVEAHREAEEQRRVAKAAERETRKTQPTQRSPRPGDGAADGHRRCSKCAEVMPLGRFTTHQGRPLSRCKPCTATAARKYYYRQRGLEGSGAPRGTANRQEATERYQHLLALLQGTVEGERIDNDSDWNAALSELNKLWLQSGDKDCVKCGNTVPPEQMFPPGPANFYPLHCKACAARSWEESHRRSYGPWIGPLPGARRVRLRNGTTINIGELARRHREREAKWALAA